MESFYWIVSMYMAVLGPATLSIVAGRFYCGRYLAHVSKKRGGWVGFAIGLGMGIAPFLSVEGFMAVFGQADSMLHFNLITLVFNVLAVATTCGACIAIEAYKKDRIWHRRR